ncbi:MAG: NAD(P)/FAD-dependent oxidoreductase [Treponema sp.]|jgi:glycerol-3-phosphate dehydrogenase|nr:NAD(P)/FAD-dependent oxidoreductase [Treponema sp.]
MTFIFKLNNKLYNAFGGKVHAVLKDGCLYLKGELPVWDDIVRVGMMSVNKKKYTVVNDILFTGGMIPPMRMPPLHDNALEGARPDVLVIGGGIVGCAIARELKRYDIDVMLVEKEHDVALHASGRNDGMIHPGLELQKGQLKKKYNDKGNRMYPQVCGELDVPFRYTGQYLCFTDGWMKPAVIVSLLYWKFMGIPAAYISRRRLAKKEPNLNDKIKCALFFPTAGVVCPYGLTIAYAENAADNGAKIYLDTAVIDTDVRNGKIESVITNHGRVYPKLVINAAGVFAEKIARLAHDRFFSIHPRRGTSMIFDKKAASLVKTIASPFKVSQTKSSVQEAHSKGGGIMHTVDGNLLVGPDAIETFERENFSTNQESIRTVLTKQRRAASGLLERDIITCFTGIRAATYEEDFIVSFGKFTENIIHAAGIQSPGLTAAPAIAVDISKMAAGYLNAGVNENFNPKRKAIVRAAELPDAERDALIKKEPDYGVIVCRCEEISRGEIIAALRRSVPCDTVDGVKRRVRPGMGRCQGSFCGPHVAEIIAGEMQIPATRVRKMSYNSSILLCNNKENI